jgi:phosphoglucosamine mutase
VRARLPGRGIVFAMTLQFGTDGVRGVANVELTPELALALGRAAARVLGHDRWVVGRDTRRSGLLLQAAVSAGLAAEGAVVVDLGVIPTPAVAHRSAVEEVPGVVLSASHNNFADNGVKFFAAGGRKLSDDVETALEAELATLLDLNASSPAPPSGAAVGTLETDPAATATYVDHLTHDMLEGRRLDGLRVVIDTANGAACATAPRVLQALGEVTVLHAQPDGTNINAGCGSTHPGDLQQAVPQRRAHLGLAFDGDADRVLAVDAEGQLVDGDHIIGICAVDRRERGLLPDDTVVITVMTNLGFRLGMQEHGVKVIETDVGDRHVLEAMEAGGWALGGEQSGHVIFRDLATTGDGLLTGLQLLDVVARTGRSLADLAAATMTRLPQVLVNVAVAERRPDITDLVATELAAAETELGDRGRVLIRASGTEPLVRVMVEASTHDQAQAVADRLAEAVGDASA